MSRIYITAAQLEQACACSDQVKLFRSTFGERTIVTVKKAVKVARLFDWTCAIGLLDTEGQAEYRRTQAAALAEYERATAAPWAKYDRAQATAWAKYDRATAVPWAKYKRAEGAAWAKCERAQATAWAKCERAQATAWAKYKRAEGAAWAAAYIATMERRARARRASCAGSAHGSRWADEPSNKLEKRKA